MLKLIVGVKGTGKTKILVKMVNEAVEASKGAVVCIEKGTNLRFDVKHEARLINTNDYCIFDAQSLFGFIAGILASNHDVTEIFLDGTLRICERNIESFEKMIKELDELTEKLGVEVVATVSMPAESASETVKKFMI